MKPEEKPKGGGDPAALKAGVGETNSVVFGLGNPMALVSYQSNLPQARGLIAHQQVMIVDFPARSAVRLFRFSKPPITNSRRFR